MTKEYPQVAPHAYYSAAEVMAALQICRATLRRPTSAGALVCLLDQSQGGCRLLFSGKSIIRFWLMRN